MNRQIWKWLAVTLTLALLVVIVVLVVQRASAPAPTPTSEPAADTGDWAALPREPAPEPAATTEPGADGSDGTALALPFIAAEAASRSDRERAIDFGEVATGDAAEDLEVSAQEMYVNGIVQEGAPELVTATILTRDDDANPPTVTVRVCLDYSSVELRTPDGIPVKDAQATQRVASFLVLSRIDDRWLVSSRSFPNNPNC